MDDVKRIASLVIFLIIGLPLLGKMLWWTLSYTVSPSPKGINQAGELIAEAAVPWWLGVITWLAEFPIALIAALAVIGFIFFLRWIGEIR